VSKLGVDFIALEFHHAGEDEGSIRLCAVTGDLKDFKRIEDILYAVKRE